MIRAVVFDLGQVLASGEGVISEPARLLRCDPAQLEELYWAGRRAYDEGGTDLAYWGPILEAAGMPHAVDLIPGLAKLDATLWLILRAEARQLLADVRAAGKLVAVLSNAPAALDQALLDVDFADEADYWFVSAAMGAAKPKPEVYYRVQEVLEVRPEEIAFIDDRPANVAGAQAVGWNAHLWSSDADTRAWLEELNVLTPIAR